MFKATRAYFSCAEIFDPAKHRDHNIWHQLDHRPENLAMPGVVYGERWVSTPECTKARLVSDPVFEKVHYLNMYWFREPITDSWKAFRKLSDDSL